MWRYYRVYIAIWSQFENVRIQKLERIYRKHIFNKKLVYSMSNLKS